MKKQTKKKNVRRNEITDAHLRGSGPFPWEAVHDGLRQAIDWAFAIAAQRAAHCPERIDAVKWTSAFFRARLAGKPAHVDSEDVAFTIALIIGAVEQELSSSVVAQCLAIVRDLPFAVPVREPRLPRDLSQFFTSTPFSVG